MTVHIDGHSRKRNKKVTRIQRDIPLLDLKSFGKKSIRI